VADSALFQMHFDPTGDVLQAARDCEADVFLQAYGNTREQLADEYGPYEDASVYMAVTEPGGTAVAAGRFIMPGPAGLKTLNDVALPPWSIDGERALRSTGQQPNATIDVATIGVRKGLRGAGALLALSLYYGVIQTSRANEMPNIVMIMDVRARRLATAIGLATQVLPGTAQQPYLGSVASTPVWAHVPDMVDHQRRTSPDAYRLTSLGVGFDGYRLLSLEQFRLRQSVVAGAPVKTLAGLLENA
jgi:hypothetical protein